MRPLVCLFVALLAACSGGLGINAPDTASADLAPSAAPPDLLPIRITPDAFTPPPREETCNGVDDDNDGLVDEGCPRRVSKPTEIIEGAAITGAWLGFVKDNSVWIQNGIDGTPTRLAEDANEIQMVGDHVAYRQWGGPSPVIVVRDLSTGVERRIPYPEVDYSNGGWALGRNWVAWSYTLDPSGDNYDVYAMQLATGTQRPIANDHNKSLAPLFDDDRLIFLDDRNRWPEGGWPYFNAHKYDVAASDLTASGERRYLSAFTETTGYLTDSYYAVGGGYVYFSNFSSACTLNRIDEVAGTLTALRPVRPYCDSPQVANERWLVVSQWSNDGVEQWLAVYDLDTLTADGLADAYRLSNYPLAAGWYAQLSGDTVMWIDTRDGAPHQWIMNLGQLDAGEFHPDGQP